MTIHLIESWERPRKQGVNSWLTLCGISSEETHHWGSNSIDKVTCPECVLLYRLDRQFDEFASLPQTAIEESTELGILGAAMGL